MHVRELFKLMPHELNHNNEKESYERDALEILETTRTNISRCPVWHAWDTAALEQVTSLGIIFIQYQLCEPWLYPSLPACQPSSLG